MIEIRFRKFHDLFKVGDQGFLEGVNNLTAMRLLTGAPQRESVRSKDKEEYDVNKAAMGQFDMKGSRDVCSGAK